MCGIVGYIGRQEAAPVVLEGLTRLEHRGYDSAGVAVLGNRGIRVVKQAGRVRDLGDALPKRFAGATGIGHTRWATHGPATDANAHPHTDEAGRVAVVHNGIIDNSAALRAELADAGTTLASDTDTEVLAHLVARSDADTLEGKVRDALGAVVGTYGLAVLHADFPDRIVVARNGSPLVVGVGDKEMYVASDLAAIVRHTTTVAVLDDGEMATVTADGFSTMRHSDLVATGKTAAEVDVDASAYEAGEHESFMRNLHRAQQHPGDLGGRGQPALAAAGVVVQLGVLDRDAGGDGERITTLLVLLGELAAVHLLGQVEVAEDLVADRTGTPRNERIGGWCSGKPKTSVGGDVAAGAAAPDGRSSVRACRVPRQCRRSARHLLVDPAVMKVRSRLSPPGSSTPSAT